MIEILSDDSVKTMRVVYEARGHLWVFRFNAGTQATAKRQVVDFAQHGDAGFTWYDAAACIVLISRAVELITKGK
jgi:hypothetical protein